MQLRAAAGVSVAVLALMTAPVAMPDDEARQAAYIRPIMIAAAGDVACHPESEHLGDGDGTYGRCRQRDVSNLIVRRNFDAVLMLGDAQYQRARLRNFMASYDPTWGRVLEDTWAIPGNHDYVPGTGKAWGFFRYFGERAGPGQRGFYSFELGDWHIVGLNSNCRYVGETLGCGKHSRQARWLRRNLENHSDARCTLAFWHRPRFTSATEEGDPLRPHSVFWKTLYRAGADVILNAHIHHYERFAPQTPHGDLDRRVGIRQWIVGTGGSGCCVVKPDKEPLQRARALALGVLKMKLFPGRYKWEFLSIPDHHHSHFEDSGSGICHGPPPRRR